MSSIVVYVILESIHKGKLPSLIFKLEPDLVLVEYGKNSFKPPETNLKIKYFGGDSITETKEYEKNLLRFILKKLNQENMSSGLEKVCILVGEKHIGICDKLKEKGFEVYIYRIPKITH